MTLLRNTTESAGSYECLYSGVSKAIRESQGILWRCSDSSKMSNNNNNDDNNNNNNNNNIWNKNDLMLFRLGASMW